MFLFDLYISCSIWNRLLCSDNWIVFWLKILIEIYNSEAIYDSLFLRTKRFKEIRNTMYNSSLYNKQQILFNIGLINFY